MKKDNKSINWSFFINLAIQVAFIIAAVVFFGLVFAEAFGKNMCNNISTCYSIVVFLVGIIIALKMKVLDGKNKAVDLTLFIVGTIFNVIFIYVAYWVDCSNEEGKAVLLLNATIWFDSIITLKNIVQVIIIYAKEHYKSKCKIEKIEIAPVTGGDLFEHSLAEDTELIKRALTDKSYKNVNHDLKDIETNFELATYGDAVIKLCYSQILLDNVKSLTVEKAKYESDKFFVEVVAKHYDILKYIKRDVNDERMPNDYEYGDARKKNNPHKYIATAVEAMIGAIYQENKDLNQIAELLANWMKF